MLCPLFRLSCCYSLFLLVVFWASRRSLQWYLIWTIFLCTSLLLFFNHFSGCGILCLRGRATKRAGLQSTFCRFQCFIVLFVSFPIFSSSFSVQMQAPAHSHMHNNSHVLGPSLRCLRWTLTESRDCFRQPWELCVCVCVWTRWADHFMMNFKRNFDFFPIQALSLGFDQLALRIDWENHVIRLIQIILNKYFARSWNSCMNTDSVIEGTSNHQNREHDLWTLFWISMQNMRRKCTRIPSKTIFTWSASFLTV